MPYQTTIGRMTRVEFFASFPSGLFVFLVAYTSFSSSLAMVSSPSLWEYLLRLSNTLKESPPMILFVIFGAYLIGSVIRSMPVRWAENLISIVRCSNLMFPYPEDLKGMLNDLAKESGATGLNGKDLPRIENLSTSAFNYWKDFLCIMAPEGFVYYQSFEARSRFYNGMFWAGLMGIAGCMIMLGRLYFHGISWNPAVELFLISLILIVAFGLQLRRVRGQETRVLLTLMLVLKRQSTSRRDAQSVNDSKMGNSSFQGHSSNPV